MPIGITLIVEILAFIGFIYGFKKFLWGPLMNVMEQRQTRISEGLAAADRGARELEEARAEGERIVSSARDEVDQAVVQARAELQREVGQLAVSGAERILKREVDAQAHNDIIDDLVAEIR